MILILSSISKTRMMGPSYQRWVTDGGLGYHIDISYYAPIDTVCVMRYKNDDSVNVPKPL